MAGREGSRGPGNDRSVGRGQGVVLGPELVDGVEVGVLGPGLGYFAVPDVEDLCRVDLKLSAAPLGAGGMERDDVLVVADHIVQLKAVRAAGEPGEPADELNHRVHPVVMTGERAPAREMPADIGGKVLLQRSYIASPKAAKPSRTTSSLGCAIRASLKGFHVPAPVLS